MEEPISEQIKVTPDTTEVEKEVCGNNTEISLGKFKDVNALLNAYNSLQSEFTKRCQRLKELEGTKTSDKEVAPQVDVGETEKTPSNTINENTAIKQEDILKDYLKGVLAGKQKAVVINETGVSVKAPVSKPKTIAEAGLLAKEIL